MDTNEGCAGCPEGPRPGIRGKSSGTADEIKGPREAPVKSGGSIHNIRALGDGSERSPSRRHIAGPVVTQVSQITSVDGSEGSGGRNGGSDFRIVGHAGGQKPKWGASGGVNAASHRINGKLVQRLVGWLPEVFRGGASLTGGTTVARPTQRSWSRCMGQPSPWRSV